MMVVRLSDDTCGEIETAEIGQTVTVSLRDENGMPIEATGIVEEILEE
jgi:hypothetical protein